MRIWIVVCVSVLVGLTLGLGLTVVELGIWPSGSGRVAFGPENLKPVPPPLPQGPPPKAAIEGGKAEYDFGKAEKETPQSHAFVIRNVGHGPLTVKMWKTSCSCTKAEVEKTVTPPGGSTKVTLYWHARALGPFRQSADVLTNDPDQPTIEFDVTGDIVSSLKVEPERVVISDVSPQKGAAATVRIYSFAKTDLKVLHQSLSDSPIAKLFQVAIENMSASDLKQESGAKSGLLVRITVKPGLPAGRFEQKIHLHLNLVGKPEVVVPIQGNVNGPIEVVGKTGGSWNAEKGMLMLGQIRAGEGAKAELILLVREGRKTKWI